MSQQASPFQTTIISVCYNSTAVLPAMLQSLVPGTPVVLVDNGSDDIDALRALAQIHSAQLIESPENIGFGAGNNLGAAAATTPYLMLLNPDATLGPDCLDILQAAARAHPEASAFGPRLQDSNGREIYRRYTRLDPSFRLHGPPPDAPSTMPMLKGAAIFVAKQTFDAVGGFDANIFLYHEDDDLSVRLRSHGPLLRIPQATVIHAEGNSTARTPQTAAFKAFHMARSKVYTFAKHGRRYAWLRTVGEALAGLVSPLMANPRKRAKAMGFLKGALSARKDGGRGIG